MKDKNTVSYGFSAPVDIFITRLNCSYEGVYIIINIYAIVDSRTVTPGPGRMAETLGNTGIIHRPTPRSGTDCFSGFLIGRNIITGGGVKSQFSGCYDIKRIFIKIGRA